MKKWMLLAFLVLIFVSVDLAELYAQCPMCRMSAESNLKDGGTAGRGLNAGILYMLSMPYLLVAGIGYVWWRNKKNSDEDERHLWN
jgi:hypothetical protein